MHHFMALRHGKVICECNFAPYPKGMWHITHSMCKSITGMAIGLFGIHSPTTVQAAKPFPGYDHWELENGRYKYVYADGSYISSGMIYIDAKVWMGYEEGT